jgi:hypothetical protein
MIQAEGDFQSSTRRVEPKLFVPVPPLERRAASGKAGGIAQLQTCRNTAFA